MVKARLFRLGALVIVGALGSVLLLNLLQKTREDEPTGPARVVDGDTLVVAEQKIRLYGLDAPESRQICQRDGEEWSAGKDATAWVRAQVDGKIVRCVVEDEDRRYGRRVATCFLGKTDLNRAIVQAGWAVAYRRYSDRYVAEEKAARTARRGLWQGECDQPEAWRRDHNRFRPRNG